MSLLLGEVVHIPSLLQLQEETKWPQWQQWVGYKHPISDDTFGYVSERLDPVQLRRAGIWINHKLKRGKGFEANKINGLLVVSLDANEQFCSDSRCCDDCLSREVTCKDAAGHEFKKTQYYHKQVYAQLSGPELSVVLDVEPMRQGEEECAAALRLLRRMRQKYGPRFFDVVVVDSWYANGPFLKTVAEELGWPIIAVLKQERYEAHQEALALTQGQKPALVVERDGRQVEIWDVRSVRFTDAYPGPVRVVRVRERWTERKRVSREWKTEQKEQHWIWVVAGDLDGYDGAVIRDMGHLRWKIENNAFGELTQHWHLTHCAHHHPVAVVALLWIKIIAFTLFHAFAILHGKLFRLGKVTLQKLRKQIYRSLLCGSPMPFFQRLMRIKIPGTTVNNGLGTADRPQARPGRAGRHRFDLKEKTEAISTQDRRPAKKPITCSRHKSDPPCEIDVASRDSFTNLSPSHRIWRECCQLFES